VNITEGREELLKDLQLIKEAVKKNNSILKSVSLSEGLKSTGLMTGIFIIFISLVLLWLEHNYGSYALIPAAVKTGFYMFVGFCSVGLMINKVVSIVKVLRRYKQDMNVMALFEELYTHKFWMLMAPHVVAMVVFIIYLSVSDLAFLIVPVLAILVALIFINLQSIINIRETLLSGVWMLVSGLLSLFIAYRVNSLILLSLTFGGGMLVLYISVQISTSREKRRKRGGR
jgi:hypothetical protein